MRKNAILSVAVAACMATALIAGCTSDNDLAEQLSAPTISLSDNVISWNDIDNADSYIIYRDGVSVGEVTDTSYTISATEEGSYLYFVVATSENDGYFDSSVSNPVTYTVESSVLSAPQVTLSGDVLSWSAVNHATGYTIYRDNVAVDQVTSASYTIDIDVVGSYNFKVVATGSGYTSSTASNSVTYICAPLSDADLADTTVYLVGDSTVSSFTDTYYLPRYGYGTQLYNYFTDEVTVVNLALSGRSSYTFTLEDNYQTLLHGDGEEGGIEGIGEGDYLIIGFGHNDEKADIERYSNANLEYTDGETEFQGRVASFQYILYNYYIKVALDAGATPILCTPIVMLDENDDYSGENGHITQDQTVTISGEEVEFEGGDYAQAIRDLGEATDTTVIDLTAMTAADYQLIGYEEATNYHTWTKYQNGARAGLDTTHTNYYGGKTNAWRIATALAFDTDCSLGAYVTGLVRPTYEADYVFSVNTDYVVLDYNGFNPETDASERWDITADGWYGSIMGVLGLNDDLTETTDGKYKAEELYTIKQGEDEEGNLTFTVGDVINGYSKFALSQDGFGAVFMQIEAGTNFTISATATIDSLVEGQTTMYNQSGFGIMLRDDIYIDTQYSNLTSNYVVAGALCYGTGSVRTNFSRLDNTLDTGEELIDIQEGDVVQLELTYSNGYTTTTIIVNGVEYTRQYIDFDFTNVDEDYMYLCLVANRGTIVTYSDIVYTEL